MLHSTVASPDLTTFTRLDELGLTAIGQRLRPDRAEIYCRVSERDPWCKKCGTLSSARGSKRRSLAHEPFGHRPTTLVLHVRQFRCEPCGRTWLEDTALAAESKALLSRRAIAWALYSVVVDHASISSVARGLGVAWHTANNAVLAEGKRLLINGPHRFDGVKAIGVDEHVWRHTRGGNRYVTVIIDLTPVMEGTGPSRLLDMIEGRFCQVPCLMETVEVRKE